MEGRDSFLELPNADVTRIFHLMLFPPLCVFLLILLLAVSLSIANSNLFSTLHRILET